MSAHAFLLRIDHHRSAGSLIAFYGGQRILAAPAASHSVPARLAAWFEGRMTPHRRFA